MAEKKIHNTLKMTKIAQDWYRESPYEEKNKKGVWKKLILQYVWKRQTRTKRIAK